MVFKIFSSLLLFVCTVNYCRSLKVGSCVYHVAERCTQENIKYFLFSSDSENEAPIAIDPENIDLPDWVDFSKSNKLIVHGYGGNLEFYATKLIRNAYLETADKNIIIVDWGKLAPLPCYPLAAFNTKFAAKCTARFLLKLKAYVGREFKLWKIHAIGFSLGAHVVSFISNFIFKRIGRKFERITALDPALPFFTSNRLNRKLDRTDADFVDVIHTNSGMFGKIEPCGHIDFYVNGGYTQPACRNHKNVPLCSHILSTVYFAESITSDLGFWGLPCYNYLQYMFGLCGIRPPFFILDRALMGEYSYALNNNNKSTLVFIQTRSHPPFALGLL